MNFSAAFILAGGDPLPRSVRDRLRKGKLTIALDGEAETARREKWDPDLICGDFDSVSAATLKYFEKRGVEILPTPDQEHTDLEKALAWCALKDLRTIWVAQPTGGRLDHSLGNLSLLRRFHAPGRELIFFTPSEKVLFTADQKLKLKGAKGRRFAVIPFPAAIVKSKGLLFEMKNLPLALGVRESVSNEAARQTVELEIKGEALVIEEYRK
jgi:thiamine pyrophosphokinase